MPLEGSVGAYRQQDGRVVVVFVPNSGPGIPPNVINVNQDLQFYVQNPGAALSFTQLPSQNLAISRVFGGVLDAKQRLNILVGTRSAGAPVPQLALIRQQLPNSPLWDGFMALPQPVGWDANFGACITADSTNGTTRLAAMCMSNSKKVAVSVQDAAGVWVPWSDIVGAIPSNVTFDAQTIPSAATFQNGQPGFFFRSAHQGNPNASDYAYVTTSAVPTPTPPAWTPWQGIGGIGVGQGHPCAATDPLIQKTAAIAVSNGALIAWFGVGVPPAVVPGSANLNRPSITNAVFGGFRIAATGAAKTVKVHAGFPGFAAAIAWETTPAFVPAADPYDAKKLFAILDNTNRLVIVAALYNGAAWQCKAIREMDTPCVNKWPAAWTPVF